MFKKDETGMRREWKDIEAGKIKELFEDSKKKMTQVFEQFKQINLSTDIP